MAEPTEEEKKAEIEKIIESGASSVTVDGRTITYRTLYELERIQERLKRKTRPSYSIGCNPHHDKGL